VDTRHGVIGCEDNRVAAITRLHDLFSAGELSHEYFSGVLEQVFGAPGQADLERAMLALPPLVRLTPSPLRLARPLVLQAADGDIQLGSGWQLATDTTIRTGFGAAQLDLTVASWDSLQINLRLETWGSIEVLLPEGVTVQMVGGSGSVHLESLSAPVPGGPVLRISTSGPAGVWPAAPEAGYLRCHRIRHVYSEIASNKRRSVIFIFLFFVVWIGSDHTSSPSDDHRPPVRPTTRLHAGARTRLMLCASQ
jgi:hypothetical protein